MAWAWKVACHSPIIAVVNSVWPCRTPSDRPQERQTLSQIRAEKFLPREQLWGKKGGFTVPVKDWLSGDFLDELDTRLPENAGIRRWFNPVQIRALIDRQRHDGDRSPALWAVLQFAVWHKLFIEGDGTRPPATTDLMEYL